MAAYDKQFLDNTGLTTTVNALWTKAKKMQPYLYEAGTAGTAGYVKFLTVKGRQYMNHPLVVKILARGYSSSTMEVQFKSTNDTLPTIDGFYHRIQSFNGTHGKSTNVGYTYEDISGIRYYHFWKQKNEGWSGINVNVDAAEFYTGGDVDTGLLTFPDEQSNTEPANITWATEVWEDVPKQTAYSAKGSATKVPQITTNAQGQVTGITEVDITGVPPASHSHGSITNDGKIGTTANLPVITGTGGAVTTGSFSTTASAVGTSSAAGTANTFSRGDHVHSISLATGDSDGQVKIAGSNVSVKGWGNKASQFSLGADSAGTRYYTMFARMSDSNTQGNGEAQVILASGAGIGATNMGTWEIIISNRGSTASTPKATMTVRCINQTSQTAPTFGYYIDSTNHYIYFGLYSGAYRGNSTITILSNNGATLQDFGDSTTAPTGWTTVTPTGVSSAVKLDTARTIQTDLASTSSASFDGSANITPGVTGTLAIGNGGTGQTTARDIVDETIQAGLGDATSVMTDNTGVITTHVNGYSTTASNGKRIYRRNAGTYVWPWIKDKLSTDTGVNISGNAATATTATKLGTSDVGTSTKPIYLAAGVPTAGSTYAGGTAVTLNGSSKAASTASFYAPTGAGTADYVLKSNGSGAPSWVEKAPKASVADSAAKLTMARKTYVTLGTASTTTTRDWSGDTTIPVDGTLAIGNGGTGATTAANARTNLSVYSKSEVDSMLTGRISVVTSLPATGEPGVIYFVGPTGSGADRYEEYIWDGSVFVKVGEKSLDLSNYVNTLSSSGTGSVVTSLSKSGNTLTANLGNIAIGNLSDWATVTDVTISSTVFHTYWPVAPTSSNDVYGLAFSNGRLIRIRNNKGTYSSRAYDQDNNTTYTNLTLGQGYGTCSTAASTVEKAVTMSGYTLLAGGIVAVKFTNALCASATMNIDTKGAKPIYIKGEAVTADNAAAVSAGDLAYFMYDGTAYHFLGTDRAATNPIVNITRSGTTFTATRLDGSTFTFTQQDNNTTYTQEKLGQGYGTCSTAEATAAKVVSLTDYELVKNGVVAIKFTYGLCASATLNINSKGAKPVFINGAAATATTCKEVQAGDIALFIYDGTQYHFLVSDRVSKSAIIGLSVSGRTITYTKADNSTGTITTQDTTYTFADSYDASTNKGATVATVTNAINALDVSDISGFGAGKTLATLTETNGKIAATFQNISITKSQVSDFSHAHGNITNGGAITADGVALASGDSLVFVDSSDSSLVKKTSITFDGSTTTSMLSQKGTWSDTIAKANYPTGFSSRLTSWTWGTLTTANGYTQISSWKTSNGSQFAFAEKNEGGSDQAVSVQIDGVFYQREGQKRVLDVSDVTNSAPTLAWNTTSTIGTVGGTALTVKLPASPNTDTKQNITLATTTKAFITGVSTTPTSTAQALTGLADTGVYLTTTAGELNATQYKVNEHCTMKYNSTKSSLDFTFS